MNANQTTSNPAAPLLKLERILVPIDFSGVARQALEYSVPLATAFGARITLIHVVELIYAPADPNFAYFPTDSGALTIAAGTQLETLAKEMIPPKVFDKVLLRSGTPYHEITQAARELNTDLIVITTHGHTGLTHVLLGSTAERIVRHATCPVLTVRRR